MSNSNKAQRDAAVLHPAIREPVLEVEKKLNAENHPFRIFEAYRTPQRQAFLYSKGRSRKGTKVTNARPWSSFHQYGLAVDFVLYRPDIKGGWSWQTSGKWGKSWKRLHEVADEFGLRPLSWEMPHLQIKGVSIDDLRNSRYPDGGDEAWAEHLEDMIIGWGGSPAAPGVPTILPARPPMTNGVPGATFDDGETDMADDNDVLRPASPGASPANNFARVHPFVEKWEGGYVDHPQDRGGPTNMGITMGTLSHWLGHPCTPADVKALSQQDAWTIMKSRYYDVVRGDDLPIGVALGAHNAAVLHGPKRGGEFLQKACIAAGIPVEVDGIVGPETLGAANRADPGRLLAGFFNAQREYFRTIEQKRPADWRAFGKGWMNRFNDIKSSAHSFANSIGVPEPIDTPLPPSRPDDPVAANDDDGKNPLQSAISVLLGRLFDRDDDDADIAAPKPTKAAKGGLDPDKLAAIIAIAEIASKSGAVKNKPLKAALAALAGLDDAKGDDLTSVNGALGKTVGKLLDGRKTAIGGFGTLLVSLLSQMPDGTASALLGTLGTTFTGTTGLFLPLTLGMTAWGVLGKVEKWVRGRR